MTWTFDDAPDSSTDSGRRDAVRLSIGDTVATDPLISDESIAFYLSENGNSIRLASADACMSISAKFARYADSNIDGNSVQYSQRAQAYEGKAKVLRAQSTPNGAISGPLFGGRSKAEREAQYSDTDFIKPSFRDGQFGNPSTDYDEDYR